MIKAVALLSLLMVAAATLAHADEQTRQVQEELRKRNLYFGDVDGKISPDLTNSLRRYQKRKGFQETGTIDVMTATSLNVVTATVAAADQPLPDIPVLRSDRAPSLPEAQRVALQEQGDADPDSLPSPPSPAEAPEAGNVTPARVQQLIAEYLREGEGNNVAAQARFFSYPVEYFKDGKKDATWVQRDIANYLKDWPERHYVLGEPVNFFAAEKEGETIVEFPITYHVRNEGRREKGKRYDLQGRTKNTWTIRAEGDDLKIVAINEQRLRE